MAIITGDFGTNSNSFQGLARLANSLKNAAAVTGATASVLSAALLIPDPLEPVEAVGAGAAWTATGILALAAWVLEVCGGDSTGYQPRTDGGQTIGCEPGQTVPENGCNDRDHHVSRDGGSDAARKDAPTGIGWDGGVLIEPGEMISSEEHGQNTNPDISIWEDQVAISYNAADPYLGCVIKRFTLEETSLRTNTEVPLDYGCGYNGHSNLLTLPNGYMAVAKSTSASGNLLSLINASGAINQIDIGEVPYLPRLAFTGSTLVDAYIEFITYRVHFRLFNIGDDFSPLTLPRQVFPMVPGMAHPGDVAALPSGNFIIAWEIMARPGTDEWQLRDRYFLIYDEEGQPQTEANQVPDVDENGFSLLFNNLPKIITKPDDSFNVIWAHATAEYPLWNSNLPIYNFTMQRFNAAGAPVGEVVQIDLHNTRGLGFAAVTNDVSGTGHALIAWYDRDEDRAGENGGLRLQFNVLDNNGFAMLPEPVVIRTAQNDTETNGIVPDGTGTLGLLPAAALRDNAAIFTWVEMPESNRFDIYYNRYNLDDFGVE